MGRRSAIEQLDPKIREQVDRLVRGGKTVDEITVHLEALLDDAAPSRSSVGRYAKNARSQMQRYREAQEVAKAWIGKLDEEPDGDVGRLLSEMLRTVAFQQLGTLGESQIPDAQGLMFLGRAIKDAASADKLTAERILRVRKEVAAEAADKASKIAKKGGLSDQAVREIRSEILGLSN